MSKSRDSVKAGKTAQQVGKDFEKKFKTRCERDGFAITRVPDGARMIKIGGRPIVMKIKSPFDWIISRWNIKFLCDTKTLMKGGWVRSMVQEEQLKELAKHEPNGIPTGYVCWFRHTDSVEFMPTQGLNALWEKRKDDAKRFIVPLGSINSFSIEPIFNAKLRSAILNKCQNPPSALTASDVSHPSTSSGVSGTGCA